MKAFMDKDFLLETETAKHLFHDYAEQSITTATSRRVKSTKTAASTTSSRSGSAVRIPTAAISATTTSGA